MSAYLFQIAREKSFDYSLIIYKQQFCHALVVFVTVLPLSLTASLTCHSCVNIHSLCKSCIKKFYFRTNHLSVESEELMKGIYSWGLAGVFVFPELKKLRECSMPNRNSSTFTLSADEWHDALTPDYWNTDRNSQYRTYVFSQFMMTFIDDFVLLPDFRGSLQV